MLAALVLAAGASTRFGAPKLLATYAGVPLIRRAAIAAIETGCNPVVVVVGSEAAEMTKALRGVHAIIANNTEWKSGIASSIKLGFNTAAVITDLDGVLITLADQPLVTSRSLDRLIEAFDDSHQLVAAGYSGTIGVPALIGKEFFAELDNLTGDTGAGRWLRDNASKVTTVPMPEAETDIDSADDLRAIE